MIATESSAKASWRSSARAFAGADTHESARAALGIIFILSPSDSRNARPRSARCGQVPGAPNDGETIATVSPGTTRMGGGPKTCTVER
jgi:hypothetical protein